MTFSRHQSYITNWNMTRRSPCSVFKAQDSAGIRQALTIARIEGLPVIPRGAGHSYTDAALNTGGVIIDTTSMRRILSWDPEQGILRVEPGVTLRDIVRVCLPDHWWPAVTPSTAEATIGGCVAMNVNGKNAWKCGLFGEHLLSLTVLLATGETLTLSPTTEAQLFHAFVGSAGLLGIITSITLQLQRIPSASVDMLVRTATSFREILTIFQEEQSADFLEAWVDGFATGRSLGRGFVICTRYSEMCDRKTSARGQASTVHQEVAEIQASRIPDQLKTSFIRSVSKMGRPFVKSSVYGGNSVAYQWSKCWDRKVIPDRSLLHATYYSPAAFAGYRALLPQGTETLQAFVPRDQAEVLFKKIMWHSQENHFIPIWCIVKQHRRDPFLLSYQVDGFSLELNYQIVPQMEQRLHEVLRELIELVIAAGGRFYLAKDALLTSTLYRQSMGDAVVDAFLYLKQEYDPEMLLQSDLFRRVFQPSFQ
ncbi:MAG TPA: FAD-binding oxidoreductase [Ktedonobacteraceae bacterium]|nr:FAD-binding oxidoreductase [Ktedonobacteraceae bacterium]